MKWVSICTLLLLSGKHQNYIMSYSIECNIRYCSLNCSNLCTLFISGCVITLAAPANEGPDASNTIQFFLMGIFGKKLDAVCCFS